MRPLPCPVPVWGEEPGAQRSKIQAAFLLEAAGENLFPFLFQLLEAACSPPPSSKYSTPTSASIIPSLLLPLAFRLPSQENLCGYSGAIGETKTISAAQDP